MEKLEDTFHLDIVSHFISEKYFLKYLKLP